MSKRRHDNDDEVEQAASMFKYATLEEILSENKGAASPKRKGDHDNSQGDYQGDQRKSAPPMTLWNKLRWIAPRAWEEITNKAQIPHPMLLRVYIATHFNVKSSNTVEQNLNLLLSLLNVH